ncbi:LuxR C-terminal-related transcriptional regulator [Streptomyces sp. NPDC006393]|uniref:helix-turn-helix transcriptional regulator n=1 Tax=Streptomyces sp. NPDC006393 TaxID=3156763 RepID=UPI0033FF0F18
MPEFTFRPQPQPSLWISRPRLLRRLDATSAPIVVVSAPAGSGKTSLLAEWSQEARARGECAWLNLDVRDNAPERLWAGVARALRETRPTLPGPSTVPAGAPPLAPSGVELAGPGAPARGLPWDVADGVSTLILDGLELLTDGEALRTLADFVTWIPPGFRVVIATRRVAGGPIPALRARGGVAEFGPDDLRFTPEEAKEFFGGGGAGSSGSALPDGRLAELYAVTEGWAAGLGLAAHMMARPGRVPGEPEDFARVEGAISDYLRAEVLDRLTPRQRDFLADVSVLDELAPGPCRAVTGQARAGALLRELAQAVQFLVPLGPGRETHRLHPALRSVLAGTVDAERPSGPVHLHQAAARWFEQHGQTSHAVRHAVLGADLTTAASAVLRAWEGAVAAGRHADVGPWLEQLPKELVAADPRLCVVGAMTALAGGDVESARWWLDLADARRPGTVTFGGASEGMDTTAIVRSAVSCSRGEILTAARLTESAAAQLRGPGPLTSWRALGCVTRGLALMWHGDYEQSQSWLGEAARGARASGHALVLVRALAAQAACAGLSGRLGHARTLGAQALETAEATGLSGHFVTALAHVSRGGASFSAHALDEADRSLTHAERALAGTARPGGEPHARALCHLLRSRLEDRRGDRDAARTALRSAVVTATGCESPGVLSALLPAPSDAADAVVTVREEPRDQELSAAERRVLRALCGPLTLREIAAELYLSHNTVKTQVRAVFRKLDAHSRPGAVARARERGIL